jgi:hypothetical protein
MPEKIAQNYKLCQIRGEIFSVECLFLKNSSKKFLKTREIAYTHSFQIHEVAILQEQKNR